MSGGIIINRRAILLPAVMDPSIYGSLCESTLEKVEEINLKAPDETTEADILTLAEAIHEACKN